MKSSRQKLSKHNLSVRGMNADDVEKIVDYFLTSNKQFLLGMGADPDKLPSKGNWMNYINGELKKENSNKSIYYIIWEKDNQAIGHCNINDIVFEREAFMHLHLWNKRDRNQGFGHSFVKKSIPYFFKNFKLETLYCRPYALNQAPNSTLLKLGFDFKETYETIPGRISFNQKVNLYQLSLKKYQQLFI